MSDIKMNKLNDKEVNQVNGGSGSYPALPEGLFGAVSFRSGEIYYVVTDDSGKWFKGTYYKTYVSRNSAPEHIFRDVIWCDKTQEFEVKVKLTDYYRVYSDNRF